MNLPMCCSFCGATFLRPAQYVFRASVDVFCSRAHFCEFRKLHKTGEQKKAEKSTYDREYRAKNLRILKKKKHEYFRRTYDPEKARIERKANMPRHLAYCRRPDYRKWKVGYDAKYRAKRHYGDFAACDLILRKIEKAVASKMSDYEIRLQQGTLNKRQTRRKALYESNTTDRKTDRNQPQKRPLGYAGEAPKAGDSAG